MSDTRAWLDRLVAATNNHDLDVLVACFATDYENTAPAHPRRGFVGRDRVRRNWEHIFALVPDVRVDVVAAAFDGATAWTQWDMRGRRRDGGDHHFAGVIVFEVDGDTASAARFFLEPVDEASDSIEDAMRAQVAQ